MVAKHVNKKMLANHVFWWLMLSYTRCSCCNLQRCGFRLLPLIMMQSHRQSEFWANSVSRIRPRLGGLRHLETFTWKNLTPAERVNPVWQTGLPWRVTPPIMRDYMDRRVTSPTWGPPSQCKQALREAFWSGVLNYALFNLTACTKRRSEFNTQRIE